MTQTRQPRGVPVGGQFSTSTHNEADGTLDQPGYALDVERTAEFAEHDITTGEAEHWARHGYMPGEAARWHNAGFSPDEAAAWDDEGRVHIAEHAASMRDAGMTTADVKNWMFRGLPDSELGAWYRTGLDTHECDAWRRAGYTPGDAAHWNARGIKGIAPTYFREKAPHLATMNPDGYVDTSEHKVRSGNEQSRSHYGPDGEPVDHPDGRPARIKFHENGSASLIEHFPDGTFQDPQPGVPAGTFFHPDGRPKKAMHVQDGELHDAGHVPAITEWDENGVKRATRSYRNGHLSNPANGDPSTVSYRPDGTAFEQLWVHPDGKLRPERP